MQERISSKISQVVPSCWHNPSRQYAGHVRIGPDNYFTEWFTSKDEAKLELRCLEKRLSYETIFTVEDEGFYPERSDLIEKIYQDSGRTNSLYTGLIEQSAAEVNLNGGVK